MATKIMIDATKDVDDVFWNNTEIFYKADKEIALFALATNIPSDRAPVIGHRSRIVDLIVACEFTLDKESVVEYFRLPVGALEIARFGIKAAEIEDETERFAFIDPIHYVTPHLAQWDDSPSKMAAALTDAKIALSTTVEASLNSKSGRLHVTGAVRAELVRIGNDIVFSEATIALIGGLSITLVAYSTEFYLEDPKE